MVSVIIPALNEEAMIAKCLTALAHAQDAHSAEVIVVDNGSSDHTVEIAESFVHSLCITVVQRVGVHVSALRNVGAQIARGEILAFLDADCIVPPDWFVNLTRNMSPENSGVVGGYIRIPENSRWVTRAWYGVGYAPQNGEVDYVPSGNLMMRRSQFGQIGGFDEALQTSEDFDLCLRARQAGFAVHAISELAVVHLRMPQTMREFYRRERWHGAHVAKTLAANLNDWRRFRAIAYAVYFLICSMGMAVGSLLAFWGETIIPALAFVGAIVFASAACTWKKLRKCPERTVSVFLQLSVLHCVYGFARARALFSVRSRYSRVSASVLPSHNEI